MLKVDKNEQYKRMEIIGRHILKYRVMMIICCAFVALIGLFYCIYWNFDNLSAGDTGDMVYLAAHISFVISSVAVIGVLVFDKYKKLKINFIAYVVHAYSFLIIALATTLCVLDLVIGLTPIIYLIACTLVAGLYVTEPRFFISTVVVSSITIFVFATISNAQFFSDDQSIEIFVEDVANFAVYAILVSLICIRHYSVTIREYKAMDKLHTLTYYDELTGLLNERSYVEEVDNISERIKKGEMENFAIVMMDVNNLKATNDMHGHRYGCHLVVRCGHTLPEIFPNSKLFHVGGDEFIAIVYGKDYEELDSRINEFHQKMVFSLIEFDGKELIFSVAMGYSLYQDGDKYQSVLERADKLMYENKAMIKAKYNLKGR